MSRRKSQAWWAAASFALAGVVAAASQSLGIGLYVLAVLWTAYGALWLTFRFPRIACTLWAVGIISGVTVIGSAIAEDNERIKTEIAQLEVDMEQADFDRRYAEYLKCEGLVSEWQVIDCQNRAMNDR